MPNENLQTDLKQDWYEREVVMPEHVNDWSSRINKINEIIPTYSATGSFYKCSFEDNTYKLSPMVFADDSQNVAPTSYIDGMQVEFKIAETNETNCLVDVNGLGAKTIKNTDNTVVEAETLEKNDYVTLRYDYEQDCFYIVTSASKQSGALNDKVDIDFQNVPSNSVGFARCSTEVTNCITEIPQTVKADLTDGVLTFKAGTIIIVPYGVEDLTEQHPIGSVFLNNAYKVCDTQYSEGKFFVWVELQNDVAVNTGATETKYSHQFFKMNDGTYGNNVIEKCLSGDIEPTESCIFYNIVTNKINYLNYSDESLASIVLSFPVTSATLEEQQYKSVDQVFNGSGYIGSTVWTDKGIKGLIPNGRNADGTLNNIEFETNSVFTATITSTSSADGLMAINSSNLILMVKQSDRYYDEEQNYIMHDGSRLSFAYFGEYQIANKVYTKFEPKTTFRAVDYNEYKDGLDAKFDKIGGIVTGQIWQQNNAYDIKNLTETTSDKVFGKFGFRDKNGVWVSSMERKHLTNGNHETIIYTSCFVDDVQKSNKLVCGVKADGTAYTYAPTVATGDSSTNIATTKWVNNNAVLTKQLAEVHVVTQKYVSGTSWYRVWSDGWIEQGGVTAGPGVSTGTITFLKPFSNTNYTIVSGVRPADSETVFGKIQHFYQTKHTTGIQFGYDGWNNSYVSTYLDWYACGY